MENLFKDLERTSRILSRVPGYVLWKYPDAQFMCGNQRSIVAMGFANFSEMAGCYPGDMKNESSQLHEQYVENTRFVFQHRCTVMNVHSAYIAGQRWGLFITEEEPLLDVRESIVGVSAHSIDVTAMPIATHLAQLFLDHRKKGGTKLRQGMYRYSEHYSAWNLSPRQGECLFWLLQRKSSSEIGAFLGLTKRTVESYIRLIKEKFQVHTLSELSDFAHAHGLQSYIPKHWIYQSRE
jgi:DNA-binding CsgD family transcriptional regulator